MNENQSQREGSRVAGEPPVGMELTVSLAGAFRRTRRSGVRLGAQSGDQGLSQVLLTSTRAHIARFFLRVPRMAPLSVTHRRRALSTSVK